MHDDTARRLFPFVPLGYRRAVELALERRAGSDLESSWFDAYRFRAPSGKDDILSQHEGMIAERRGIRCGASPAAAFAQVVQLGGDRGWLYADFLWSLRGALDRLAGGPGMRRGRRSPTELRQGDAVDFWRVEEIRPPRLLRLRAEMRVPGRAWIQFEVNPADPGCEIVQTAFFEPRGLLGQSLLVGALSRPPDDLCGAAAQTRRQWRGGRCRWHAIPLTPRTLDQIGCHARDSCTCTGKSEAASSEGQ